MRAEESIRDQALLRRIVEGDQAALSKLFRQYAPTALALALRVIRDRMLAEDVVQEAFLALWERPEVYQSHRGSVRTFLFAVVHNRAVDRVRREAVQRRRTQAEGRNGPDWQPAVDDVVTEALALDVHGEQVRAALRGIPDAQRRIIELMYFDGLTQRQVSEQLQLPLGTVKSRTLLAMRKLHSALIELRERSR